MTVERSLTRFISTMATAAWDLMPRWGRWLSAIVLVLWLGWTFLLQEQHGGASIVVHSVIDRPISYVYVNGKMGSNTFAFDGFSAGGGGSAGPYRIDGDTVKIDWELDMTEEQEKAGYRFEKHSLTLPMPKREKGQNNFHVLFLPDNKVMVRWGGWAEPVMNDVIDNYRTRK
ncbi:TPA: DUF3304 domain-containing protein [Aeromonas dhakensis]|uniref:DUF3304 domain-containing protein n=1 Tax=Aeromonas TaxID=642 RepID=UPI00036D078A|nr:DUF3304 domain-containing protein [Aeromonas dhakensis]QKF99354.1 DUF3304 domain-containing protein [Aeromonas hydrophila]MBL0524814.1 DUF3304 domain-containing protein [Aeromonas dhakensis]MBW3693054.1 DUF3304 domain-containing protein [Aeromonas dhakensis]OBR43383.1 hypothetical protein A9196_17320 [Aeromonas dhakensis]BEE08933.1 hypothetical protein VAWG003_17420 [Aeromonas dhakensis]